MLVDKKVCDLKKGDHVIAFGVVDGNFPDDSQGSGDNHVVVFKDRGWEKWNRNIEVSVEVERKQHKQMTVKAKDSKGKNIIEEMRGGSTGIFRVDHVYHHLSVEYEVLLILRDAKDIAIAESGKLYYRFMDANAELALA